MKKTIINSMLIAFIAIGAVSCNDSKNEAKTSEAKTVAEATNEAVDYKVDAGASTIKWHGTKPTGSHHGTIDIAEGTLMVKGNAVEAGKFVIDMKTINDEDLEGEKKANLEAHLMGTVEGKEGDFFNVNKYPTATFQLTAIEAMGDHSMVKGNLTIKDKTNHIEFPATVNMDVDKITLESKPFTIDRTKWGVNYGSKSVYDNLGDKFISDDIELTVSLVAKK
ncbi:YceI family protein [Marixanthomonas spongiae]|uniref:Lipid-binding protein n=1 Tax=Marixanthomonas spongiae TaxID=2174845 RepID=A0A2U0I0C2_9FLAO|nr:YceI family protein [Marixanthomonas spongiae]PVW14548.1 lipid-binding protein [Marixanthomonas spongiae]